MVTASQALSIDNGQYQECDALLLHEISPSINVIIFIMYHISLGDTITLSVMVKYHPCSDNTIFNGTYGVGYVINPVIKSTLGVIWGIIIVIMLKCMSLAFSYVV